MSNPRRRAGMTMLELLVALAVLAVIFVITSSGIVTALRVQRAQEDATSSQSKLRRVVEVQTQELRGAVLGAITDYPVTSGSKAVSFGLLTGDGGLVVEEPPGGSWHNSNTTDVYASSSTAVESFVGHPALMVTGANESLLIPAITGAPSGNKVRHNGCKISADYTQNTRLYRVRALGVRYDPDDRTLYQLEPDTAAGEVVELPLAFDLNEVTFRYAYESTGDTLTLATPRREGGRPVATFEEGGSTYELARLQLTMSTEADSGGGEREYVSYVEMRSLGNDDRIGTPTLCGGPGQGGGGQGGGDGQGGGGGQGGDDDEDEGGNGEGGDGGPGGGPGTGNEDDDDEPCEKGFWC